LILGVFKPRPFLKYWLPVLLWMGLIFSASSDSNSFARSSRILAPLLHWLFPHLQEDTVNLIVLLGRKGAHVTEYAVLALLLWRAWRRPVKNDARPPAWPKPPPPQPAEPQPSRMPGRESRTLRRGEGSWDWREARLVLLSVALYAASDEFHQLFVPGRDAAVHDVFIDTAGGAAGLFALWLFGRWRKHW
jgi:VanZ family protein